MDIDARIKHKMEPPALGPGEGERISHRTLGITTSITRDLLGKVGFE